MNAHRFVLLGSLFLSPLCFAAEAPSKTLTPGDNLVIDGIPPIPADLVEQIGRYTESRAAAFQDWHPAKAEMLITTRFGDTNQVHRVVMPGGARMQLTFFPDRIDGARATNGPRGTSSFSPKAQVGTSSIKTTVTILPRATSRC
jgi:hypothetical protein